MRRKRLKAISIFLTFVFLFSLMPVNSLQADEVEVRIDEIQLLKTYQGIDNVINYFIYIKGQGLSQISVWREKTTGGWTELKRNYPSNTYLEFTIPITSAGEGDVTVNKIRIDTPKATVVIPIAEDDMPRINTLNPTKVRLNGGPIEITGENFSNIGNAEGKVKAKYFRGTTEVDISEKLEGGKIKIETVTGALGTQNLYFERKTTQTFTEINPSPISLKAEYRHLGVFRIYEDLDISPNTDIEMYPNRGPKGTKVYFQADKLQKNMSVFFLKVGDGSDTFKQSNKGKFVNFIPKDSDEGKDVLIIEIPPTLAVGEYNVYFTNEIKDEEDPEYAVTRERSIGQVFTIIDSSSQGQILSISPNRGSDGGIDNVIIQAKNIASISPNVFVPEGEPTVTVNGQELEIKYNKGKYKEFNRDEEASLTRTIKFLIGDNVTFNDASKQVISPAGLDNISVNIPQYRLVDKDTPVDVTAIIKTTVKYGETGPSITFHEEIVKTNGFTFYPSSIEPVIEYVVPDKIMIDVNNNITEDRMIAIYGKNFMIHKYEVNGEDVVRYPVIKLGSVEINKNTNKNLQVLVMDSSNNVLDGSSGREVGSKILITIPQGTNVGKPGTANVEITNPMRFSQENGRTGIAFDIIEFVVNVEKPYITKVNPDTVTVGGGEKVTIEGSNFRPGVRVFIDGNEVNPRDVERDGTGTKITIKAPPGRQGVTQLQVMNTDGGIAVWPFTYVTTYTDPKITDFNPKIGTYNTLVVVKGQNFLRPDPTAEPNEVLKLIGARILLEYEDINHYHRDEYNRIALQSYTSPVDDLVIDPATGQLSNYYHSVVFEKGSGNYYVLRQEPNGIVQLTNGRNETYVIEKVGADLKARGLTGQSVNLTVERDKLIVDTDELIMKTPYYVENGVIVGNRVKVIDTNEIHFEVPNLQEGYHDLTVINPDTKSDSRTGNQGFYYYKQPDTNPVINEIVPSEGSTKGGYTIDIIGSGFQEVGSKKTLVTINGITVSSNDTKISPDETKITIVVPAYPGDLWKEKGTGRWTVPVVVVNPDGASDSRKDGFTYVVPSSNPEIIKIEPPQGSAAGNDIVEIIGRDFRFFEPYEDRNNSRSWEAGEPYSDLNGNGKFDDYRNKTTEQWKQELKEQYEKEVIPVLPKVYFGDIQAEILEFSNGYLKVQTPPHPAATVDVYVVNNDAGVSNKVSYKYLGSNPKITKIVPNEGSRFGRDKVEITGEGFFSSKLQVYSNSTSSTVEREMPLVRFGQIEGINRIDNQRTTVELKGGLEVSYDATSPDNKKLRITLKEGNAVYETTLENYDDTVKFVNLGLLRGSVDGTIVNYGGFELIKIAVEDRRLKVERGYSPDVVLERSTKLVVNTPSYPEVGKVKVSVINQDGGIATGDFEYKNPGSNPQITNITRDTKGPVNTFINGKPVKLLKINYKSKSRVAVFGVDFREDAKIQIGSLLTIEPKDITYELPNKLSFNMPEVPKSALEDYYRLIVTNKDGKSASSDSLDPPILIQFTEGETDPKITRITPMLGPVTGGTVVKIEGEDFRASMEGYEGTAPEVYFGEQPASKVEVVDYKTIQAISPVNKPGIFSVRVENPDGSFTNPGGDFNYISSPKINAVVSATDPTETTRLKNISVEGGAEIKIKGVGFMEGAKVVFMPVIKESTADTGGNIIYRVGTKDDEYAGQKYVSNVIVNYLLEEGVEGTEVKFIDTETLTVKVPAGKLEGKGIIVINPDKGASDIFDDITYTLPELEAPLGVTAELIHDKYNNTDTGIKVTWNEVAGATEYELYVVEDGQMKFIGSTKLKAYIHEDLQPRTTYKFIVKAVGNFGSSKPSAESNTVRTSRNVGLPDYDGGLIENTRQEKKGNTAQVVLGTRESRSNLVIDLTRGDLAGARELVLSIPAQVIVNNRYMNIEVRGSDWAMRLTPAVFNIAKVQQAQSKDDAGVRFKIAPGTNNSGASANGVSQVYELKADFYEGANTSSIEYLATNMSLVLDYDVMKVNMRKFRSVSISRFDPYSSSWQALNKDTYLSGSTSTIINRMGNYVVMGGRN